MICGKCGKKLTPGSNFCPGCGVRIGSGYHGVPRGSNARDVIRPASDSTYRYRPDKTRATHTVSEDRPRQTSAPVQAPRKAAPPAPRKKSFRFGWLLVLGLFLLYFHLAGNSASPTPGRSAHSSQSALPTQPPSAAVQPAETIPPVQTEAVQYADEILVRDKNKGGCLAMTGDVGILYVFLDDGESRWTQQDMNTFLAYADSELKIMEEDARSWGADLSFSQYQQTASVSFLLTFDNLSTHLSDLLAAIGQDPGSANADLAAQLGTGQAFPIFLINKNGRSVSFNGNYSECCIVFQGTPSLRHEICHVFGAADYYYTRQMQEQSELYLPNSVMNDPVNGRVDALSAYLIGWTPDISPDSRQFLDSVSWMTQADLDAGSQANTITGYATIPIGDATYEGYLQGGFPHGTGSMTWPDGAYFYGEFDNGVQTGYGSMHWADGAHYEGPMKEYAPHGTGTMTWTDGATFYGEFDRGIQTGYGSMRWSNGSRFEGDMQEYSPHGYGTMHYNNGVVCTGTWDNGNFLG